MAVLPHSHIALKYPAPPLKRRRRTATEVMAGAFDFRPRVDVLTSVLNGVKPYRPPLSEEELRLREVEKEQRKLMQQAAAEERNRKKLERKEKKELGSAHLAEVASTEEGEGGKDRAKSATDTRSHERAATSFWQALPSRLSAEILESTPEPSDDDSSSRTSSKRPHTPIDDMSGQRSFSAPYSPTQRTKRHGSPPPRKVGRPPKKRRFSKIGSPEVQEIPHSATSVPKEPRKYRSIRKGWKGWVEADEEEIPRDKLIELDQAIILHDRRTRSGKNFDAIGEGKDTWV